MGTGDTMEGSTAYCLFIYFIGDGNGGHNGVQHRVLFVYLFIYFIGDGNEGNY